MTFFKSIFSLALSMALLAQPILSQAQAAAAAASRSRSSLISRSSSNSVSSQAKTPANLQRLHDYQNILTATKSKNAAELGGYYRNSKNVPKQFLFNNGNVNIKNTKTSNFFTKTEAPVVIDGKWVKLRNDKGGYSFYKLNKENNELVKAGFWKKLSLNTKGRMTMRTLGQLLGVGVISLATYSLLTSIVQNIYGKKTSEMAQDDSYEYMNQADAASQQGMNQGAATVESTLAASGVDPNVLSANNAAVMSQSGGPMAPPSMATGGAMPMGMAPPSMPAVPAF